MHISKTVENGLTVFTVKGEVKAEEIIAQAVEAMAAPEIQGSIWDFSQASSLNLTRDALEKIARRLKSQAPQVEGGRVALVGSKKVNIGLGKVFQVFAAIEGLPYTYRVFRNYKQAIAWLKAAD